MKHNAPWMLAFCINYLLENTMYTTNPQSWFDMAIMPPVDIRDLVANFSMTVPYTDQGIIKHSTDFLTTTWYTNNLSVTNVICQALRTDDLDGSNAQQWNFAHQTVNTSSTLALPLKKVIYLRGGLQWNNVLTLDLGGASYNDFQLTFRDNAGTAGDYAGLTQTTIPVVEVSGHTYSTSVSFNVVLKKLGKVDMVLRCKDSSSGNISLYEMEWNIVA